MLSIKVTKINERYHCRLWSDDKIHSEMACQLKSDIGWTCRELLRWYDKSGLVDPWAVAARTRQNNGTGPKGRIWWPTQLR